MITREQARKLRKFLENMSENASDEEALENILAYPKWAVGKEYTKDDRVRYEDVLYKVLQNHTSQPDWTPDIAHSLWTRIDDPGEEWPEWRQPSGSTDYYRLGAKVSHNGKHWISTEEYNVWEPGVYGWDEV